MLYQQGGVEQGFLRCLWRRIRLPTAAAPCHGQLLCLGPASRVTHSAALVVPFPPPQGYKLRQRLLELRRTEPDAVLPDEEWQVC